MGLSIIPGLHISLLHSPAYASKDAKRVLAYNGIVSLDQTLGCDWSLKCHSKATWNALPPSIVPKSVA
jgi:hypothetical protein